LKNDRRLAVLSPSRRGVPMPNAASFIYHDNMRRRADWETIPELYLLSHIVGNRSVPRMWTQVVWL